MHESMSRRDFLAHIGLREALRLCVAVPVPARHQKYRLRSKSVSSSKRKRAPTLLARKKPSSLPDLAPAPRPTQARAIPKAQPSAFVQSLQYETTPVAPISRRGFVRTTPIQ